MTSATTRSNITDPATPAVNANVLDRTIDEARQWMKDQQKTDGHWVFPLEADATIPAEYIMFQHYLNDFEEELNTRIVKYLLAIQNPDGGWPLFYGGKNDVSATVKAYYALKLCGHATDAPHMAKARQAVLAMGGAAKTNVLTRFWLALYQQIPWTGVPNMPIEAMLLPRWFPFHVQKISYWARTTLITMMLLMALKPRAANPRKVDIRELFTTPPEEETDYNTNPTGAVLGNLFLKIDKILHRLEPFFPKNAREKAIQTAVDYIKPRLNGIDGIGAIFPPMIFTVISFKELGMPDNDPDVKVARDAVRALVVEVDGTTYVQPCWSPVWDTGLAVHGMMEAGEDVQGEVVTQALDWLKGKQVLDVEGDWAFWRPKVKPGGWAFQYENGYFPDVDDTAVVVMALDRSQNPRYREAIERGTEWIIGMQSKNGGWGAFDADNLYTYLNHIPFADHGAMLDPPTEDVSARCLGMLAQLGYKRSHPVCHRAVEFLKQTQQADGSWFGRWGTNYVYGTWSVLNALNAIGEDLQAPYIRKAVDWLKERQREDGGWGEDGGTYWQETKDLAKSSTASQTAWAVLGLMAAGDVHSDATRRGIEYLLKAPRKGGEWDEAWHTAVGFPRVFYLRYHGYRSYFPLWALARYRNLSRGNAITPAYGI